MGGHHSTHTFNPPQVDDTIFTDIGCIGLKTDDYVLNPNGRIADNNLLASAPFLWYTFRKSSYDEIKDQLSTIFANIKPGMSPAPASAPASAPAENFFGTIFGNNSENGTIVEGYTNFRDIFLRRRKQRGMQVAAKGTIAKNVYSGNGNVYGPVYMIIAQDTTSQDRKIFETFVYFPSMNKNGNKYKNFIELNISHRWIQTLLYSRSFARKPVDLISGSRESTKCEMYNGNDKLKYGCRTNVNSGDSNVATACKETEEILRLQGTFLDGSGPYESGDFVKGTGTSHSDNTDYGDTLVSYDKAYYPSVYFHTYQLNTTNPLFGPYMNSKGFNTLQLNGMTDGMDFYAGCQFMLISPNGRLLFILNKNNLSLIFNSNLATSDIVETCYKTPKFTDKLLVLKKIKFNGVATRLVIEQGVLNIYANDVEGGIEDIVYSVPVVDPKLKVQPPYIMKLDNTGRLHVYDNRDVEVTSLALSNAFAYDGQPNEDGSPNSTGPTLGLSEIDPNSCISSGPYDAASNHRCRFLNLVAYLQMRGLLKTLISNESNDTDNGHEFQVIYDKVAAYDSSQDYVGRIIDLVNYIEVKYKTHIDDSVVNSYLNLNSTRAIYDQTEGTETTVSYDNVAGYNQQADAAQRLADLQNYMQSFNLLKGQPFVDYNGLQEMTSTLPITSQLSAPPEEQYDAQLEYNRRLMVLQSDYPADLYGQ
jgi:hypothetical protein